MESSVEKMVRLLNDLQEKGIMIGNDRILCREDDGKKMFVIGLAQTQMRMEDAKAIRAAVEAEFPEITRFICVKEAVSFTIES